MYLSALEDVCDVSLRYIVGVGTPFMLKLFAYCLTMARVRRVTKSDLDTLQ